MFDTLWLSRQLNRYAYFAEGQLWQSDYIAEGTKIYRAKVLRPAPALGGVFADVGTQRVLVQCGQETLPQAGTLLYVWEAEPANGSKLMVCKLHPTLADSLVVLCPDIAGIRYAKGLDEATRRAVADALAGNDVGCIVRSGVGVQDVPALVRQLTDLMAQWHQIVANVGVGLVYQAPQDPTSYLAKAHEVWCDDQAFCAQHGARDVPDLAQRWATSVDAALNALGERVACAEGVELVIQRTEACWMVDVNSHGYVPNMPAAQSALAVNRIAAAELARQLCLRNITGAVLVDFINMEADGRHSLWQCLQEQTARDSRVHLADMTKLGFVELTRSVR